MAINPLTAAGGVTPQITANRTSNQQAAKAFGETGFSDTGRPHQGDQAMALIDKLINALKGTLTPNKPVLGSAEVGVNSIQG